MEVRAVAAIDEDLQAMADLRVERLDALRPGSSDFCQIGKALEGLQKMN